MTECIFLRSRLAEKLREFEGDTIHLDAIEALIIHDESSQPFSDEGEEDGRKRASLLSDINQIWS